ncbi:MAG: hypothetical protein ACI9A2_004425 [Halioglobus sp.]|jgi:hypothetical protein
MPVYRTLGCGCSSPIDFIARLAALVPKPRVSLTRSGGSVRIVAYIEEQDIIDRILGDLRNRERSY